MKKTEYPPHHHIGLGLEHLNDPYMYRDQDQDQTQGQTMDLELQGWDLSHQTTPIMVHDKVQSLLIELLLMLGQDTLQGQVSAQGSHQNPDQEMDHIHHHPRGE